MANSKVNNNGDASSDAGQDNCVDDDIVLYSLPKEFRPGTDRISKFVLKDPRIKDILIKTLVDKNLSGDTYILFNTEHNDRSISDIIYAPVIKGNENIPPIIIEVQNKVDTKFINRAVSYCTSVYQQTRIMPILLVININGFSNDNIPEKFKQEKDSPFLEADALFWAKKFYVLTSSSITKYVEQTPMDPIVALAYFLIKQETSILSFQGKLNDPTLRLLFKIAKNNVESIITLDKKKEDLITEVSSKCGNQFQKIINSLNTNNLNELRKYAEDGVEFIRILKRKHERLEDPPAPIEDIDINISDTDEMGWIDGYIKSRQAAGANVRWKDLFDEGRKENKFLVYKNATSLKSIYYQRKKNRRMQE